MAETILFDGGSLSVTWEDEAVCTAHVTLDQATGGEAGVWVVTVKADRFDDGIFAWQLHWSEEQANVIVLPNDFLTSRAFTLEQLGISIIEDSDAGEWTIRIPRNGLIPEFVAPGDRLEVHALWIRQEPLARLAIPDDAASTPLAASGGGGSVEETEHTSDSAPPLQLVPSVSPLPSQTTFELGTPIHHAFIAVDPETGRPRLATHATATLLLMHKGKSPELLVYKILNSDDSGLFELRIETTELPKGQYQLYVWVSGEEHAHSMQLELVESTP